MRIWVDIMEFIDYTSFWTTSLVWFYIT